MKKIIFLITLFLLQYTLGYSQRYENQIFDEVSKQTVTYLEERGLEMDIYRPVGDEFQNRPVILFVHGGGFAGGARDEPEIVDFCKNMARRGFVTVSISYTLVMKGKSFSCDRPAEEKLWTFKHVADEIIEATNYLIKRADELKIDANLIVLAGSSAGAEAVLHTAFSKDVEPGLPGRFKYAGLISMAGAVYELDWIDKETAIPMQLFHGTCDDLVPYDHAPHHYCEKGNVGYLMLHGLGSITKRLRELNKGYYLVTGCNDNHVWAGRPFKKYRAEIADFIFHDIIQKKKRQIHHIIPTHRECSLVTAPLLCEE